MKLLVFSSMLFLVGCANTTETQTFQTVRNHYNTLDLCQHVGKPDGYKIPGYCYTNANKRVFVVTDMNGRPLYKVQ